MPVVCALTPRFQLLSALGGDGGRLRGPVALAPEPGAAQLIGEVSRPAEALGVRAGMRMGEALSRCPELALVQSDPELAERDWESSLRRLEGIGAEVESPRPGEAFFESAGLHALYGGIEGVLGRVRGAIGAGRLGAAPGRFCAYAAARATAPKRRPGPVVVPEGGSRRFLSPLPVALLHGRLGSPAGRGAPEAGDDLPNELERLGIATLGDLASLPRDAVADRFGPVGLAALDLALGRDRPLRPRRPAIDLAVEMELPEAVSGPQLERACEMLIARLLAHPARSGRALRSLRVSARLAAGGGWRRDVTLRSPSAERRRLALALSPMLLHLPAPASVLRLEATGLGAEAVEQLSLDGPEQRRRRQIAEAVRQVRAAGGSQAVLRVLDADPASHLPERRAVLIPFPEESP